MIKIRSTITVGMRASLLSVLLVFTVGSIEAQSTRLESYQNNFSGANRRTKLEILNSAALEDAEELAPLFHQAIEYAVDNAAELSTDSVLPRISRLAVDKIEEASYVPAAADVWRLFENHYESSHRIRMLEVLARIGQESETVIDGLLEWVRRRHVLARGGERPDYQVLATALDTLGTIGDPRAYTPLLDAVRMQYPGFVDQSARNALERLEGDRLSFARAAVRNQPIEERRAAFNLVLDIGNLSDPERMEFARGVLSDALNVSTGDVGAQAEVRRIRFRAAEVLRGGAYSSATPEVVRHFNQTVLEFERGRISSGPLLEAIATLGAMDDEGAAERLTRYLELINTYTETDRPYDVQIVLAVITNLEKLASPDSYDALFYTTRLENYPSRVHERARQAMSAVLR